MYIYMYMYMYICKYAHIVYIYIYAHYYTDTLDGNHPKKQENLNRPSTHQTVHPSLWLQRTSEAECMICEFPKIRGRSIRVPIRDLQGVGFRVWEFPKITGTLFRGPYFKDPTI